MSFMLTIEGPFQWRPGRYRSRVATRWWWGWFAIKRIHVSEYEYATTAYDWKDERSRARRKRAA